MSLKRQILLSVVLILVLVWGVAGYEIYRSHQVALHEAEVRTAVQAQVFAEYSRSTLKRINEFILDVRADWTGDWKSFDTTVVRRQENVDDLTFQVAVLDKQGVVAYSSLSRPPVPIDLSQREHFRAHSEANNADKLFISKPVLGKVSGKWSIQVTRPILQNGSFSGVVVVSVSPEQFAGFAKNLRLGPKSAVSVVRSSGELMARYPALDSSLGTVITGQPFQTPDAALTGNFRQNGALDGVERIFGYYGAPEFGMTFVIGDGISDILQPHYSYQGTVIAAATGVNLLALILCLIVFRSLNALDEVRRQLDAIFALSPDGFVSFDGDRRVKYVSPTFTKLTGLTHDEVIGKLEEDFARLLGGLCNERTRLPAMETLRQHQEPTPAANAVIGMKHQRCLIELTTAGNRLLEVGLRTSAAESVSQIMYFRDITHEAEVDRMKSEFLSTAAHELRTPMASIYGYSELMLATDFPFEERREFLGIIHRQSELMVSIINELLDLVRIEERRGKDFTIARIDALALVREAVGNFKRPEGAGNPEIVSGVAQSWVRVDRNKVMQAIGNVLSNAYKYSDVSGALRIALVEPADQDPLGCIGIRITDQGIGMTPQQLERVCERFYRADTSGKIPGTGLGMSIVKEIIELHGGSIAIESQQGKGTTVTLWLPLA